MYKTQIDKMYYPKFLLIHKSPKIFETRSLFIFINLTNFISSKKNNDIKTQNKRIKIQ